MRPKARKARWEGHSSLMVKDFSAIMKAGTWKASADTPVCGEGSTVEHTAPFSSFLTRLCSAEWGQVRSVADLGCGDLTFMSSVDIGDIRYRGFDCARGHIKKGSHLEVSNARDRPQGTGCTVARAHSPP